MCRVYKQESKSKYEGGFGEVSNPGEWPWAVLIFSTSGDYVGSGVLVDNDVVVTTATKVQDFRDPSLLTVRLGDFDPNLEAAFNDKEDFPHAVADVECIRLHPGFDYPASVANNVAVLKIRVRQAPDEGPELEQLAMRSVVSVISIRSAPERDAYQPEGIEGSRRNKEKDELYDQSSDNLISVRAGLLADMNQEVDALGELISGEAADKFMARSYMNTVCLPERNDQFRAGTKCWLAAWEDGSVEQREVGHIGFYPHPLLAASTSPGEQG